MIVAHFSMRVESVEFLVHCLIPLTQEFGYLFTVSLADNYQFICYWRMLVVYMTQLTCFYFIIDSNIDYHVFVMLALQTLILFLYDFNLVLI